MRFAPISTASNRYNANLNENVRPRVPLCCTVAHLKWVGVAATKRTAPTLFLLKPTVAR